jgi:hypothetical protein
MAIGGGGANPPWAGITVQFGDKVTWVIWGDGTKMAFDSQTGRELTKDELPPEDH